MADKREVEDEADVAKPSSAEDRKAASALANLDSSADGTADANVDQDAVSKAMKNLRPGTKASAAASLNNQSSASSAPAKNIKVDPADVTLLIDELEIPKAKATELLKNHDGDAVSALRAYVKA